MLTKFLLWIGCDGKKYGFALILMPIVWDILMKGARDYQAVSVCWKGVIIQILGALMIMYSRKIDRELR